MINLAIITFLLLSSIHALEVDDRLLASVIGISESKKTIMINKGKEQGVRKNLHAKFSTPTGVVARGIAVRVSPSRSIWSLYRVWKKEAIDKDVSLLLKISKAVKLTSDETKSLGKLADKVDKKTERLNIAQDRFKNKQQEIKNSMLKKNKRKSAYSGEDFSTLEESRESKGLDKEIDWSALDGKKDTEEFDKSLDYTTLN